MTVKHGTVHPEPASSVVHTKSSWGETWMYRSGENIRRVYCPRPGIGLSLVDEKVLA